MKNRENPKSDTRLDFHCPYCGLEEPNTDDHVPSKILLDEPFPDNLHKVRCCLKCNHNFSLDEEYFACLLECVICGSTVMENLRRDKIKAILTNKPLLKAHIERSKVTLEGRTWFQYEKERVENVILKLARGHAKFENSNPKVDKPTSLSIVPIEELSSEQQEAFFFEPEMHNFPEVGSRALFLVAEKGFIKAPWIIVQPGVYQYLVSWDGGTTVKILLWDYLAVQVIWD